MISLKKIVAAGAVAITALASSATSHAGDYGSRHGYGYGPKAYSGYSQSYGHGRVYGRPAPQPYYYHGERRRDRTGKKIATGVAIGVGALILGSILANQGRRYR
jgi:hypothetical protein